MEDVTTQGIDATTEMRSGTEAGKKRWRVILWFIGEGAGVKANSTTPSIVVPKKVGELMRYIFKDCYSVRFDESFAADDYLKGTISFKLGATDEDGYANIFKQWTTAQGTTALTVVNATAHRGTLTWNTTTPAWTGSYRT